MQWQILVALSLSAQIMAAQTVHFKTRAIDSSESNLRIGRSLADKHWRQGRSHYLLQFKTPLNDDIRAELAFRGAVITGSVPDNALIVAVGENFNVEGLDLVLIQPVDKDDKVSPLVGTHGNDSAFVVEFHADVNGEDARALLGAEGVTVVEHPDLAPTDILVLGSVADADRLKQWDEVAYVFPAPAEMAEGDRFHPCAGALLEGKAVAQYVRMDHGWSADANGRVTLGYVFGELTGKVANATVKSEIVRAMAEWSKVARVQFAAASSPMAARTVAVKFAARDHGDGIPFDGPNGTLAHTFYPTNPEPIAGDLHLDSEEGWHAGTNIDVYTVALHELGHALGLGHSDQPGAIMYPYYRFPSQIGIDDIAGIQAIYGAPTTVTLAPAPSTTVPALALSIQSPSAGSVPVNTVAVNAAGTVSNGSGAVTVTWQTNRGASGRSVVKETSWSATAIPTPVGSTTLTIVATDSLHRTDTKSVALTRALPIVQDTVLPTLSILTPFGTSVQTSQPSIALAGIASDNVEVTRVAWQTSAGANGSANGTKIWSVPQVPLLVGANTVTVRAYDAAGNSSWRAIMVTRR